MIAGILFGFLPLLIWLYLLLFHNGFWLLRERDTQPVAEPETWPSVVAVVPSKNATNNLQYAGGAVPTVGSAMVLMVAAMVGGGLLML